MNFPSNPLSCDNTNSDIDKICQYLKSSLSTSRFISLNSAIKPPIDPLTKSEGRLSGYAATKPKATKSRRDDSLTRRAAATD